MGPDSGPLKTPRARNVFRPGLRTADGPSDCGEGRVNQSPGVSRRVTDTADADPGPLKPPGRARASDGARSPWLTRRRLELERDEGRTEQSFERSSWLERARKREQ